MTRHKSLWPGVLVIVMMVAIPCGAKDNAHKAPAWTVHVRVFDFSRVSQELLRGAEQEASLVFHPAGIALVWVAGPLSAAEAHELEYRSTANDAASNGLVCDGTPDECRLDIRLVSGGSSHFSPSPLGEALPFARAGIRATIFSDRVQLMISRRPGEATAILGHVLAHEIGHVLLGTTEHATGGLMRASWQDSDLERMPRIPLSFERAAIRIMNDRLRTRKSTDATALLHLRPCVSAEHHIGVRSNCPLWTMCINSIPIRTRRALENLLNPSIGWMRDLIHR